MLCNKSHPTPFQAIFDITFTLESLSETHLRWLLFCDKTTEPLCEAKNYPVHYLLWIVLKAMLPRRRNSFVNFYSQSSPYVNIGWFYLLVVYYAFDMLMGIWSFLNDFINLWRYS